MIVGTVGADYDATISVTLRGPRGGSATLAAVIDTGFDGEICLPPSSIDALGLRWRATGTAMLADGRRVLFDTFEATVLWHGAARSVLVDSANTSPLVGMGLMAGYQRTIEVVQGGRVTLTPLD
jgi:clan AA aspartic protease